MSRLDERVKVIEKLRREHHKLDEKVTVLEGQRWLTAQEEVEMRRLKKLKLAKKDQLKQLEA